MLSDEQVNIVEEVIWLADQAVASNPPKYGVVDLGNLSEMDFRETVQQRALERFIDNLSVADQAVLQALMIIGRSDNGQTAADYPEYFNRFLQEPDDHAGAYLGEKVPLPQYLRDGLKEVQNPAPV